MNTNSKQKCKCRCHWGYVDHPELLRDSISECSHCQPVCGCNEELRQYCGKHYREYVTGQPVKKCKHGKTIQEWRIKYQLKDAPKGYLESVEKLFSQSLLKCQEETRKEMIKEIKVWANQNEPKNGLDDSENNKVFFPKYPMVFKNDLLNLLQSLSKQTK